MKSFFSGIRYNLKGLRLGMKSPKLLILGLIRFAVMVVVTITAAAIILANYQEILNLMWNKPDSAWIVWAWYLVSWLVALLLMGISAVVGFLISQILFSVMIMDKMSQIIEKQTTGTIKADADMPYLTYFFQLLRQETPRALIPVVISLVLLMVSWFTPLGPVITILSPLAAVIFLAWDNTDLVPARRMLTFKERFYLLRKHLGFHLGFGLLFLIPVANLLFLSFAPIGATLFYLEMVDTQSESQLTENTSANIP